MNELLKELKKLNVYWITPGQEQIFAQGELQRIFELLQIISNKYPEENFNMMPKLVNVHLCTGEVCEGIVNANFRKGEIEIMGIYIYDYTKVKYELLYSILQSYFTPKLNMN
jgi:hypothetical protein